MPIYDLVCTMCGYEQGETIFPSYDAFRNAEQERECPDCHSKLEAKIATFNTKGKKVVKTTDGKIIDTKINASLGLAITPCGEIIPSLGIHLTKKYSKDPELN